MTDQCNDHELGCQAGGEEEIRTGVCKFFWCYRRFPGWCQGNTVTPLVHVAQGVTTCPRRFEREARFGGGADMGRCDAASLRET